MWKGDILVADLEELETMDASEVHPRRINTKKNVDDSEGRRIHILSSRWYSKIVWKALRILGTHSKAETPQGVKDSVEKFKANRKSRNRQNQNMTLKHAETFGLFKETSFIVVTMNLEFNSVCRKKKQFPSR